MQAKMPPEMADPFKLANIYIISTINTTSITLCRILTNDSSHFGLNLGPNIESQTINLPYLISPPRRQCSMTGNQCSWTDSQRRETAFLQTKRLGISPGEDKVLQMSWIREGFFSSERRYDTHTNTHNRSVSVEPRGHHGGIASKAAAATAGAAGAERAAAGAAAAAAGEAEGEAAGRQKKQQRQ